MFPVESSVRKLENCSKIVLPTDAGPETPRKFWLIYNTAILKNVNIVKKDAVPPETTLYVWIPSAISQVSDFV